MTVKTTKSTTTEAAAIREVVRKAMILAQIRRVKAEVEQLEKLVSGK